MVVPALVTAGKWALAGLSVVAGVREARKVAAELPRGELAGMPLGELAGMPLRLAGLPRLAGLEIRSSLFPTPEQKAQKQAKKRAEKQAKETRKRAQRDRSAAKRDAGAARKDLRSQASAARSEAVALQSTQPGVSRERARYAVMSERVAALSEAMQGLAEKLEQQGQEAEASRLMAQSQLVAEAGAQGAVLPEQMPEGSLAAAVLDALSRSSAPEAPGDLEAFVAELARGDVEPDAYGAELSGDDALALCCGADGSELAGKRSPLRFVDLAPGADNDDDDDDGGAFGDVTAFASFAGDEDDELAGDEDDDLAGDDDDAAAALWGRPGGCWGGCG